MSIYISIICTILLLVSCNFNVLDYFKIVCYFTVLFYSEIFYVSYSPDISLSNGVPCDRLVALVGVLFFVRSSQHCFHVVI